MTLRWLSSDSRLFDGDKDNVLQTSKTAGIVLPHQYSNVSDDDLIEHIERPG